MARLEVGTLAYIDGFGGLVPCKVLEVRGSGALVKVTAKRPGYVKGETTRVLWHGLVQRKTRVRRGSGHVMVTEFDRPEGE
jgi:hypothetical protein